MKKMDREERTKLIRESDADIDPKATDVVYGAAKWAKDGVSAILTTVLVIMGVVVFFVLVGIMLWHARLAIEAPMISVIIISFVLWFIFLRVKRNMQSRFEKKFE